MHLYIGNSIHCGLTQASMRYAKVNNKNTSHYNPTKSKSWIFFQDYNNLYKLAMPLDMLYNGFKLVEPMSDELYA